MCFYGLLFLNCCKLTAEFYVLKFILHQLDSLIQGEIFQLEIQAFYAIVKSPVADVSGEGGFGWGAHCSSC